MIKLLLMGFVVSNILRTRSKTKCFKISAITLIEDWELITIQGSKELVDRWISNFCEHYEHYEYISSHRDPLTSKQIVQKAGGNVVQRDR